MMTFEEIHQSIVSGHASASLEEAEESLELLIRYSGKTEVMIAIRIAEAKALYPGKDFWIHAAERWPFEGDKTVYHLCGIGQMLIALRDFRGESDIEKENRALECEARKQFARTLEIAIGKLQDMTTIYLRRGIVDVINFLKLHYRDGMTREELRALRNALYQCGRTEPGERTMRQLSFEFDAVGGTVDPGRLADLMESDAFDLTSALRLTYNGVTIVASANAYLARHADAFGPDEIDGLEDLARDLDEAKRHIDGMIAAKKRHVMLTD